MSIPALSDSALLLHAHAAAHLAHLRLLLLLLGIPHLLVIVAAALHLLVAASLLLLHLLRRIETALLNVTLLHADHLSAIVALLHATHLGAHRRHDADTGVAANDDALLLLRHDHAVAAHLRAAVLGLGHLCLHLQ